MARVSHVVTVLEGPELYLTRGSVLITWLQCDLYFQVFQEQKEESVGFLLGIFSW